MQSKISKNLRVILLDRDGVINREPGPILSPEKFEMIPKSAEAIARINVRGWRCFVITNQAAFARGDLTEKGFQKITNKMELELQNFGAYVNGQYVCPHHPEWENGIRRTSLKLCDCRKPGTLLLQRAAEENNFSANEAVFIGDSSTDFEAAAKWGTISIGVQTGNASKTDNISFEPNYWKDDLWEAVDFLLEA